MELLSKGGFDLSAQRVLFERSGIARRRVRQANRRFYDAVAGNYETLDGRRSSGLEHWIRRTLSDLRVQAPGGRLLDLGTGGGLIPRCAEGLFDLRCGVDISPGVLSAAKGYMDLSAAADADHLPFPGRCFDVVTCFAVLHHLFAFDRLVVEAARVLRPGGIFYTDHDMDSAFYQRFRWSLLLFRALRRGHARYRKTCREITPELYRLTEWQETGVNESTLSSLLCQAGFQVRTRFHWFGLLPITDALLGKRSMRRGWAPILAITAKRGDEHDGSTAVRR